jgi:hypothetical protein
LEVLKSLKEATFVNASFKKIKDYNEESQADRTNSSQRTYWHTEQSKEDKTTLVPGVKSTTSDKYCHLYIKNDIMLTEHTENTEYTEHIGYTEHTGNKDTGKRDTGNWTKMVVNTELTETDNTTHAPGVTSITSDNYCHHHITTAITLNEHTENTERTEHTEYIGYTDNRNTGKRVTGNWTKMVVNIELTKEDNTTHTPEVKTGTTLRNVEDYSSVPEMNSKDDLNCRIQGPLNTEKEARHFPFHPCPFSCLLFPFVPMSFHQGTSEDYILQRLACRNQQLD